MIVVMLITAVETTGDVFATGEIVEKKVGQEDVTRALRADGLATMLGGILNSFPYTCFAENVGLVRLTAIKSRWVVATAGGIMIIVGLIPKAGAVAASIPHSVLGGAALAMFATVAVVGFQMLGRVDFNDHRNVVIVATSVGLAMLVTVTDGLYKVVPGGRWSEMIFNSGITLGSITAILLNLIFHHVGKSFGPAVAGAPGEGLVRLDQVNQMSLEEFKKTFSGLFQDVPWAVERAYERRPFSDTEDLRAAFHEAMFGATPEEQLELLRSYPDLGAATLSQAESQRDQSALGLNQMHDEDYAEFETLNKAYREKFGFPYIASVRSAGSRAELLDAGEVRLQHSPSQERATAMIEVGKIINHRFDDLVAEANPIHTARTQRYERL
jgi:uric acid transporter